MKVTADRLGPVATAAATVLAPISWGTTYLTITSLLPSDRPLFVAALRVVPAGLVLLAVGLMTSRWRPTGGDWWRTSVLALSNFAIFFPLLFVAVYRLPGGVAAAMGGIQPLLVAGLTWMSSGRRPRTIDLAVGVVAVVGVSLVVIRPGADIDPIGVLAAFGANVSFAIGVVLTKRFPTPPNRIAATGWQLTIGGVLLAPLATLVEGAPPSMSFSAIAGGVYLTLGGTAVAYVVWFNGIRRLPSAAPPLLGLAAPITGAALGWIALGESLSPTQLAGVAITVGAIAYGAVLPARMAAATAATAPVAAVSATPAALTEAVADRPHGVDQSGALLAELGAQAPDVDVDGARAAVVLVAPHPRQQHLAREHLAGVLGEELQQLVLHVREIERTSGDRGLVGLDVERQVVVLDRLGLGAATDLPHEVSEPCLQLGGVERCDAEVVEEFVAQGQVGELATTQQHEHGQRARSVTGDGTSEHPCPLWVVRAVDNGAAPCLAVVHLGELVLVDDGLPRVATEVECACEVRGDGITEHGDPAPAAGTGIGKHAHRQRVPR